MYAMPQFINGYRAKSRFPFAGSSGQKLEEPSDV
jgi:hypothetical protein